MEQGVSLRKYLSVFRQIRQVNPVQAAKHQVQETPSPGRPVLDNPEIFRRKKYERGDSIQISGFFHRKAVQCHSLRTVFLQVHVDSVFIAVPVHNHPYMAFLLTHTDHVPVPRPPVGLCRAGQIDSLKYICFSLRVASVQNIDSGIK